MLSAKCLVKQNQQQQQQQQQLKSTSDVQTNETFTNKSTVSLSHKGLKEKFPNKSTVEAESIENEKITKLQNDLFEMLQQERIERTIGRCQADYNIKTNEILVRRKIGKWQMFGEQMNDGNLRLKNHEALYLIEMNRLELFCNSALISLENAYELLLDEQIRPEVYSVYSELTRAGYILEIFNEKNDIVKKNCLFKQTKEISMVDKCIWQNLYDLLAKTSTATSSSKLLQSKRRQFSNLSTGIYENIKKSMNQLSDWIKQPLIYHNFIENKTKNDESLENVVFPWNSKNTVKRKIDNVDNHDGSNNDDDDCDKDVEFVEANKKIKLHEIEYQANSFLDDLSIPTNFSNIFKEIQIIHLTSSSYDHLDLINKHDDNKLKLDFDVYLPDQQKKKSQLYEPPGYRILVVGPRDPVPNRQQIVRYFMQLKYRTPIIVIFVNESMAMHSFLYHFSI